VGPKRTLIRSLSPIAIYEYTRRRRRTAATITSLQEPPRDSAGLDFLDDGADVGGERISGLATGFDGGSPGCGQTGAAEFLAARAEEMRQRR
jgi:hypothetical protein